MKTKIYYKFLTLKNTGGYSDFVYPVCKDGSTEWLTIDGELELCKNGFHVCRPGTMIRWMQVQLFECVIGGEVIDDADKICCSKIRLTKKVGTWGIRQIVLFAEACVARVAHLDVYAADAASLSILLEE